MKLLRTLPTNSSKRLTTFSQNWDYTVILLPCFLLFHSFFYQLHKIVHPTLQPLNLPRILSSLGQIPSLAKVWEKLQQEAECHTQVWVLKAPEIVNEMWTGICYGQWGVNRHLLWSVRCGYATAMDREVLTSVYYGQWGLNRCHMVSEGWTGICSSQWGMDRWLLWLVQCEQVSATVSEGWKDVCMVSERWTGICYSQWEVDRW